jgi:glutathione S-transferase
MLLRSTPTSPYGRKVRIAALHLGLMDRIAVAPADPLDPGDVLRSDNPLGKMPVLILDDGRRIYDSRVILEHLDHLAGGDTIIPQDWDARLDCLTLQALADGIMDAAILIVYEARHRPQPLHHPPWLEYQHGKIQRGLAALSKQPPDARRVTAGTIAAACMLGYLDWRQQVLWRDQFPRLIDWLDAFRAAAPAFDLTAATPGS